MEAVWSRFFPAYAALENEVKSGKLGDILFVEVNFGLPIAGVDRLRYLICDLLSIWFIILGHRC